MNTKVYKDWTIFDVILLLVSVVAVFATSLIFGSDFWNTITAILYILAALHLAKGKVLGYFLGLIVVAFYCYIIYRSGLHGEMIHYLTLETPLWTAGIIGWLRNHDDKTNSVKMNTIHAKEWCLATIGTIAVSVAFYFILRALHTSQLLLSTISIVVNVFSEYLIMRRSKFGFVGYIACDMLLILLWGVPMLYGEVGIVPMFINGLANLAIDIYGLINWVRLQREQNEEKKTA